jgi:tetratricopeptide (TPR) repeat protein
VFLGPVQAVARVVQGEKAFMFWKKKSKDEGTVAAPAAAPREEPRRPDPPRQEARREETRRDAPTAASPSSGDQKGRLVAALTGGSPVNPEVAVAQARAIDSLLADPALRGAVQDLLERRADRAFEALERDADAARSPEKWSRAGALMLTADGPRARRVLEKAFAANQGHFWSNIFLARLRGGGGEFQPALDAASAALMAARTPDERGVAHAEIATIAMVQRQPDLAVQHAGFAVEISHDSIKAGARDAYALRDYVARLVMLGDACVSNSDVGSAGAAYLTALEGARKLAAADPKHPDLVRGVAEILEKTAASASSAQDHAAAARYGEEAVGIRSRMFESGRDAPTAVALAGSLNTFGEVKRQSGDLVGARGLFEEAMAVARQAIALDASNVGAKREVWSIMWRLATMGGAGVSWRDVVAAMEGMANNGGLNAKDRPFYEEAKKRAALS